MNPGKIASTLLLLFCLLPEVSPAQTADLYVSPKGNDAWSGKLPAPNAAQTDGPLASPARAQAALRELRKAEPSKAEPNKRSTVMLRAGTYYLPLSHTKPGTLVFSAFDSGTPAFPITWQNYPGETPIISGGEPVGKSGLQLTWKNVSGALWQVTLPANTQPFEYLFYNGERRLRSRVQSASGSGYYARSGACYSTATTKPVEMSLCNLGTYLKVAAEIPAKGENAGCPAVARNDHPSISKCLDRFLYDPKDPIANWINLNPNDTACPPASGPAKAYPVGDVELTLFSVSTVDVMRVSCVDTAKHTIYLSAGTRPDSADYDSFGPVAGHRYLVENTKDAFDAAAAAGQTGLWFLDRSTSPWTLNYLANIGENPNNDSVVIAQVSPVGPIGGSLISAVYLDCVTFRGITFEVDNFVPPPTGFNNDELSDDTLPEAIDCVSCQQVAFEAVTVRHTSASGIMLASGSGDIDRPPVRNKIVNSAFYDIGDCGIRIGRHPLGSDRPNHVVQFVTIENNIVQGYSRVFAGGIGISQGNGHDVAYVHNDITDGYNGGLSVCSVGCPGKIANGFNITAQYNHIWDVVQGVTAGDGIIYFNTGANDGSGAGNKIANNLLHDARGANGIFLDNQSADIDVEHNVMFHVSESAVVLSEGPPPRTPANRFHNNIFVAGKTGFTFPYPWKPKGCAEKTLRVSFTNNIFEFDGQPIQGCAYSCELDFDQFESFQGDLYWRKDGSLSPDAKAFRLMTKAPSNPALCDNADPAAFTTLNFAQWQQTAKEDAGGTASVNPGFGKTGKPSDYLLSKNPIAGFDYTKTNDTIRNAGRNHPVITPPKVAATFPIPSAKDF